MKYVQFFKLKSGPKLTSITKSNPPTQTSGKIQLNEDDPKHQDPL